MQQFLRHKSKKKSMENMDFVTLANSRNLENRIEFITIIIIYSQPITKKANSVYVQKSAMAFHSTSTASHLSLQQRSKIYHSKRQ